MSKKESNPQPPSESEKPTPPPPPKKSVMEKVCEISGCKRQATNANRGYTEKEIEPGQITREPDEEIHYFCDIHKSNPPDDYQDMIIGECLYCPFNYCGMCMIKVMKCEKATGGPRDKDNFPKFCPLADKPILVRRK